MLRITKLLLSFGHVVLGVDSSCQVAQKLSYAATSLAIQAHSVYPSCTPTGIIDITCSWTYRLESRLDREIRSFAPDVCYWTLATGYLYSIDKLIVKYNPHNGC